jgi:hypothetical protein
LTKAETGWKYFKMLEENEKIKKGMSFNEASLLLLIDSQVQQNWTELVQDL